MDLIINEYGTKVGSTSERIVLSFPKIKEKKEYPIRKLEKIVILRPASITTNAVKLALEHNVDIVYLGSFGKPVGRIFSSEPKGLASLRRAQLEVSISPEKSFQLAKIFVKGKCANQISYLHYLGNIYRKDFTKELTQAQTIFEMIDNVPEDPKNRNQLLGIEGSIAEKYFSSLRQLFLFPGRKPQGRDKFNSALNYGYGFLYNELERMCMYVGLDPYLGLYHSERYGKPALVLDLVEEFRVPIVDSVIFPLFIEKKINRRKCFEQISKYEYQLSQEGKSLIAEVILKRLNQIVPWREKNYTLKAVIGNQVRALARHFMGREAKFTTFDTSVLFK